MADEFEILVLADTSKAESDIDKLVNKKHQIKIKTTVSGKQETDGLTTSIDNAKKSVKSLEASFKNISATKIKYDAFKLIEEQCKNAVESVKELNDAMTLVNMTMLDMPDSKLKELASQSLDMAKELSVYTKTVTDAVTIYANANESVNSIVNKTQPTVLLASASGMSASKSADAIQGIMNQFHLAEEDAMNIADVIEKLSSEISLDFSKGISDISEAVSVSGSVVEEAGMSFEKYASIVSATAEKTRVSGSVLGNAYKTIFSRISRSKDGETTDAEKSQAEKALNSVGVSVRGIDGDLRDVSDILDDLNAVWGTLNQSEKSYVAEQASGVRQKNIFTATMDNYSRALELEEKALNSSGTAMEINEKRVDSIEGKMQKLSATMTDMYNDAVSEDAVKGMLDFATGIAEVVDKLGLLQGAVAGIGALGTANIIGKIASNWTVIAGMLTNPTTLFAAGIGAVVSAVSAYKRSVEEMVQSAKQAGSAWEESNDSIESNIDKITELRTALDSGTLTEEEAYTAKSELLNIQQSLTESYGEQVSGIDLVNGALEEQIDLLRQAGMAEADRFLNENRSGIAKAEKEMTEDRHTVLGQYDSELENEESVRRLNEIIRKYADDGIRAVNDSGMTQIQFEGDVSEAEEVLNDFMTDIRQASEETGDYDFFEMFSQNAESGLNEAKDVLDEYQELYRQAQDAKMLSDKALYSTNAMNAKTASNWMKEYSEAIQNYNDAVSSKDASAMQSAKTELTAIQGAVDYLLDNDMSEYASSFKNLAEQIDSAGYARQEFENKINGTVQDKWLSGWIDTLKSAELDDIDFLSKFMQFQPDDTVSQAIHQIGIEAQAAGIDISNLSDILAEAGIISGNPMESGSDAENIVTPFKEMLSDDTFTTRISDYTSEMEKLTAAKESLNKTGGKLDISDLKDMLNDIPELSDYMDDLEGGIDSLTTAANSDILDYFAEQIQNLKDAGMDADASALEAYAQSVVDAANEIEGAFIEIGGLKVETPDLADWENAGEKAGTVYEEILSGYEAAKKAYENDEVGDPAFKSFAKMISPTGSDDAANFVENMSKFERYFQDGSDGCLNFLHDLESLNLAEEENGEWTYKLGNSMDELKTTAEKMGIGFEPFMAMFGKLEDYGFHNDFFVTEEDGAAHVADLYDQLAAEKLRLAQIEANPNTEGYDTAVQASEDKIAELEERIAQSNKAIDEIAARAPEEIAQRAEYAKNVAEDLQQQIAETDDEQLKASLQQQLDDFAEEHNLVIDVETGDITSLEEAVSNIDGIEIDLSATGDGLDS